METDLGESLNSGGIKAKIFEVQSLKMKPLTLLQMLL